MGLFDIAFEKLGDIDMGGFRLRAFISSAFWRDMVLAWHFLVHTSCIYMGTRVREFAGVFFLVYIDIYNDITDPVPIPA